MAEKLSGTKTKVPAKTKSEPRRRKPKDDAPMIGHNLSLIQKSGADFLRRLDKIHYEKEESNGEYMSDIANLYEEMAEKVGVPKKLCREFYTDRWREQKKAARRAEMTGSDREALETLEAAFGPDTPFGQFAGQKAREADEVDEND